MRFYLIAFISLNYVCGQWVERSQVIGFAEYYQELIQETIYEVERRGFCNLKLNGFNQTLNEQMYNWLVNGTVQYSNGFVVSIEKIDVSDIRQSVGTRLVGEVREPFAVVTGRLHLRNARVGFDVLAEIIEGDFRSTGVYTYNDIQIQLEINKNLISKELGTSSSLQSLPGGTGVRMIYHPANNVTQVLARRFLPSSNWDSVEAWGRQVFAPIMLQMAKEKLTFPKVCFNTNCQ